MHTTLLHFASCIHCCDIKDTHYTFALPLSFSSSLTLSFVFIRFFCDVAWYICNFMDMIGRWRWTMKKGLAESKQSTWIVWNFLHKWLKTKNKERESERKREGDAKKIIVIVKYQTMCIHSFIFTLIVLWVCCCSVRFGVLSIETATKHSYNKERYFGCFLLSVFVLYILSFQVQFHCVRTTMSRAVRFTL